LVYTLFVSTPLLAGAERRKGALLADGIGALE